MIFVTMLMKEGEEEEKEEEEELAKVFKGPGNGPKEVK